MADFPPLPTISLATLCEVFPTMQRSVVEMILEESQGNCEKAMELLLAMSEEQIHSPTVQAEPSKTSLSYVSAALLSPRASSAAPDSSTTPTPAATPISAPPSSPHTIEPPSPLHLPPGPLTDLHQGHHVLVILRGLPGSGKSTLAKRLLASAKLGVSLSTDNFFMSGGVYTFRADLLTEAHAWNQSRAMAAVKDKVRLVIVDNTNTMAWEMRPYIELALNNRYKVHILEPDTPWKFKPKVLAGKNSHKVPKQKIEGMLDRYEKNVTLERLKNMWNISEPYDDSSDIMQEEDIFESEDEAIDEQLISNNTSADDQSLTMTPLPSLLNPAVREFVPAQYQGMVGGEKDKSVSREGSDHSGDLDLERCDSISDEVEECPDIARLLAMFPHLSIEQAITLYNQHGQQTREVISTLLDTAAPDPPESSDQDTQTVSMALDPIFAVTLQEWFGPPVDNSLLQFLNTGELLSMDIPVSLARQIFSLWQSSLQSVLHNKPVLETSDAQAGQAATDIKHEWSGAAGGLTAGETAVQAAGPRTVLAPNAVDYYEKKDLDLALKESLSTNIPNKVKPVIVVRPMKQQEATKEEEGGDSGLNQFIEQRDRLYKKAMETRGNNMQGAASYYAAQARELNTHIKTSQKQSQMEMFLQANKDSPNTRLDLHYLQTSDAIKQLHQFISQKAAMARSSSSGFQSVEIITGKGNRSENGKSRLRPAVQNWLDQKNYFYSEVNCGCFRVRIKSD